MTDDKIVKDMTARELKDLMKDVPRTYFKAACEELKGSCRQEWKKDMHEMGEVLTGMDLNKVEDKDHIRGVYKFADNQHKKSILAKDTVYVEVIKNTVLYVGLAIAIYLGLK